MNSPMVVSIFDRMEPELQNWITANTGRNDFFIATWYNNGKVMMHRPNCSKGLPAAKANDRWVKACFLGAKSPSDIKAWFSQNGKGVWLAPDVAQLVNCSAATCQGIV